MWSCLTHHVYFQFWKSWKKKYTYTQWDIRSIIPVPHLFLIISKSKYMYACTNTKSPPPLTTNLKQIMACVQFCKCLSITYFISYQNHILVQILFLQTVQLMPWPTASYCSTNNSTVLFSNSFQLPHCFGKRLWRFNFYRWRCDVRRTPMSRSQHVRWSGERCILEK
jgi:hypothetical protein